MSIGVETSKFGDGATTYSRNVSCTPSACLLQAWREWDIETGLGYVPKPDTGREQKENEQK